MTKKIKIFVDAHVFDSGFQGTRTFIKEIYNCLAQKEGLLLYLAAYNIDTLKENFPEVKNISYIKYKSTSRIKRLLFEIPRIIKQNKIDFAHFQYISPLPVKNCRYIVTLHDILFQDYPMEYPWAYRIFRNYLFRKSIQRAAIKTTVSQYSKEQIAYHYKIRREELHIVPNGVNNSFGQSFASRAAAAEFISSKYGIKYFMLYVSRIEPRKNHLMLLNAFQQLRLEDKNISLVFIGMESIAVPDLKGLLQGSQDLPGKYLYWYQQVDQYDLEAFYLAASLFVFPSKSEGFGIPPLEAGLCKTPVLCSRSTAMKDFTFFYPYTFDPNSVTQLTEGLLSMIKHPPSNEYLQHIRQEILEKYSWRKSGEIIYSLIKSYPNL